MDNNNNLEKTTYLEFSDVEKKKSGLTIAIIALVVIAILGVGGYFAYNKFFNKSPKDVYTTNLKSAIKKVNNSINEVAKYYQNEVKGSVKVDGLLFTMSGFDIINDYEFTIANKVDENNKIALTSFEIADTKNKNKLDADIYLKDGDIYLDLNDTYKGIIKLTNDMDEETRNIFKNTLSDLGNNNYVKFSYLLDKITNLYLATLENEDFKQENVKITINGKEKNLTSTSVIYTEEKANKALKSVVKGLLDDEVSISYISNITNTSIDDVKEELNDILNDEIEGKSDKTLNVSIYTKGSNLAGLEMSFDGEALRFFDVDKDIELTYTDAFKLIGNYDKGGKITLSVNTDDKLVEVLNLTVNEYTDNKADVDFKISDKLFGESDSSSMTPSISGNIKNEKSTNGTTTNEKTTLALTLDIEGMTSKVTLNFDTTSSTKTANIDVDLSSAKELSEKTEMELETKLMEKIQSFSIYKALEDSMKNNG